MTDHEGHSHHSHHGHHDAAGLMAGNPDAARRVKWAMWLTGSFMLVEAAGGLIAGSLALIADAGHMLTDTAALALAWFAFRLTERPADPERSYGYARGQVLAALINGITLFALVAWIFYEAVLRLMEPQPIMGGVMLGVAVAGLAVNIVAFLLLRGGARDNLNVRGALLHVLGDLFGSAAAILAAIVILLTGWFAIDPLLSFLVGVLILRSAWMLVSESIHVLMEGTPGGLSQQTIKQEVMRAVPEVEDVHHVHAWALVPEHQLVTLHVRVRDGAMHDQVMQKVKALLAEVFGVAHSTVQIEYGGCPDEDCPPVEA